MANTKKDNLLKNITRAKTSWLVKICRFGEIIYTENFRDIVYGTKDESLRAAIICRDNQLKKIDKLKDEYVPWRSLKADDTHSTSGILGVTYLKKFEQWKGSWRDINGKPKSRSFSIKRYGEEKAKYLAIEAREVALKELKILKAKCQDKKMVITPVGLMLTTQRVEGRHVDVLQRLLKMLESGQINDAVLLEAEKIVLGD